MNTVVLAAQSRQGDYESPEVMVPLGISEEFGMRVELRAIIPNAVEYADAGKSLRIDLWQSLDGGATWRHRFFFTWHGDGAKTGRNGEVNPPPGISFMLWPADVGTKLKVAISIPAAFTIGAEIETF